MRTRYHFHETLRQYAEEKLVESGEAATVRARHLKYFLRLSEHIEPGLRSINHEEWFTRAIDERDNLHAALEQATKTDIEAGLYISSRLEDIWERYEVREGSFWLAEYLQNPESKQYTMARARALCAQGWLLVWLEKYPQARGAAEESLALSHTRNDIPGEIDALILMGVTYSFPGNRSEGNKLYKQALTLSQSLGDIWRQAQVNYLLGWDHSDYRRCFTYWEKAVALFREAGDQRYQANVLYEIALFRALNGDTELAQKYLDEAAVLFPLDRQIADHGHIQVTKSIMAIEHGDYDQAHTLLQEVLVQSEKSGNRWDYLWTQARSGHLALRVGNIREAREIFAEIALEFQKNNETIAVVFTLEGMAGVLVAIGRSKNAAQLIGWANATRKEFNNARPLLEQRDVDKVFAACISKMGEAAFADAYDDGQVMTLDEAVALALNEST